MKATLTLVPALALAALMGLVTREAHAKETLLGYVNLQRAILEVEEGKRAKASLKKSFEAKQKVLQTKELELQAMKEAIDKEMAVKPEAATGARRAEFQQKLMELQQTLMKEQRELQELEAKELSVITDKMRKVIDEVGKGGNYTLILEVQDNRLLYGKPHLDLTNEIIRKYNQRHK